MIKGVHWCDDCISSAFLGIFLGELSKIFQQISLHFEDLFFYFKQ